MVLKQLAEGHNTVNVSIGLTGYASMEFVVNVDAAGAVTCVSVNDVAAGCDNTVAPYIHIDGSGTVPKVTIYLAESEVTGFATWLASKGGHDGITVPDIISLRLAYLGTPIDGIDFVVIVANIIECRLAYLG